VRMDAFEEQDPHTALPDPGQVRRRPGL
jgi:hypothetical protein